MYIPFEDMPDHARVWVYQANRDLDPIEVENLENQAKDFVSAWTAHGTGLKSSSKVFYNRFLILSVDEDHASASGCSIDSSVRFIKSTERAMGLDFFNRTLVAFLHNEGLDVQPMSKIKELVSQGIITKQSITFNNLVDTVSDLKKSWKVPSSESWLARYF